MCLAIPGKILNIEDNNMATVDFCGVNKEISLDLLEDINIGDFVLVHAGFAIEKIDKEQANFTLSIIDGMKEVS